NHTPGGLNPRADRHEAEPADDGPGRRPGRSRAVPQLAEGVVAPTIRRVVGGDGARGLRAGAHGLEVQPARYEHGRRLRRGGPVAQRAGGVVAPAVRGAVTGDTARVGPARTHRREREATHDRLRRPAAGPAELAALGPRVGAGAQLAGKVIAPTEDPAAGGDATAELLSGAHGAERQAARKRHRTRPITGGAVAQPALDVVAPTIRRATHG